MLLAFYGFTQAKDAKNTILRDLNNDVEKAVEKKFNDAFAAWKELLIENAYSKAKEGLNSVIDERVKEEIAKNAGAYQSENQLLLKNFVDALGNNHVIDENVKKTLREVISNSSRSVKSSESEENSEIKVGDHNGKPF